MTTKQRPSRSDRLSFWLTNRIPRHALTRVVAWFSRIENRLLAMTSIWIWQRFVDDLRLFEAKTTHFKSLHQCFTRELKPGARPVAQDRNIIVSPCDAELGAMGRIESGQLVQAKGLDYTLVELLKDQELAERYQNGWFLTLRLKSSMYHRFHAPMDCRPEYVDYIAGDVWNVNPATLRCMEKVFCKNERIVVPLTNASGETGLTLVAVAAVLVASIRLTGLDTTLDRNYRGARRFSWPRAFGRGDEMGYFQHGSTIIVLADGNSDLHPARRSGEIVRMGQPLLLRQTQAGAASAVEPKTRLGSPPGVL